MIPELVAAANRAHALGIVDFGKVVARMSDSTRTLRPNTSLPCVAFKTSLALGNLHLPYLTNEIEGDHPVPRAGEAAGFSRSRSNRLDP
jgi:hypothetical protein